MNINNDKNQIRNCLILCAVQEYRTHLGVEEKGQYAKSMLHTQYISSQSPRIFY